MSLRLLAVLPLAALLLAPGCDGGAPKPAADTPPAPEAPAGDPADAPPADAASTPAADATTGPAIENPNTKRMAASHILIAYGGAVAARSTVSRSKDEARARAEEALAKVKGGADFALIARAYSDDSTAPRGGRLGSFDPGTMVAPFEAAVKGLKVGEISGLVETPFGFHIIRRDALVEIRGGHLYIGWAGAKGAPAEVTRSRADAEARLKAAEDALAAGTEWGEVVRKYSDGPLKEDSGDLGWFSRNQLAPALDTAVFALGVGQVTPPIETPSGFHVLKRME